MTCYAALMTIDRSVRPWLRSLSAIVFALSALAWWGAAVAQADGIVFDVEIFRVDLVRGDDGDIVERFVPVEEAVPGEVIEYRVTAVNEGDIIYRPGTVVVTLPFGQGLAYIEDTATPSSDRVITEFTADGGASYSEPPVLITDTGTAEIDPDADPDEADPEETDPGDDPADAERDDDADTPDEDGRRVADPAEYDAIRWTFSVPFEPGQEELLVYRVEVL